MIDNGRTEEICRQMDDLADEDHTHTISIPEEIEDYRVNWWDSFEQDWFRYNANPAQI